MVIPVVWKLVVLLLLAVACVVAFVVQRKGRRALEDLVFRLLRDLGEASAAQVVEASNGKLELHNAYEILREMVRDGIAEAREDYSAAHLRGGRPRILYRLTGKRRVSPQPENKSSLNESPVRG